MKRIKTFGLLSILTLFLALQISPWPLLALSDENQNQSQSQSSRLTLTRDRTLMQEDLQEITSIDLNSHTLTITDGWQIEKDTSIQGPGNVLLEGESAQGLEDFGLEASMIIGSLEAAGTLTSLSIGAEVNISSNETTPIVITSNGSLETAGSIENTAGAGKKQSAILLGLPSQNQNENGKQAEESKELNYGASLTLTPGSKVSSTAATAIEVLSQAENVSIKAEKASIAGGPYSGLGLDFAGSGKADLIDTDIEAALAVLNIGGALHISNPSITSLTPASKSAGQAGYIGPNGAIVDLLLDKPYNCTKASIELDGTGTLLEQSSADYSILLYTKEEEGFVENTANGNIQMKESAIGPVVSMSSPAIQFSKPIPPDYLTDGLAVQLASKINPESLYVYSDKTLDELLYSCMEDQTDTLSIWTADSTGHRWNEKGVNLVFNNAGSPWLSYDLHISNGTAIALPELRPYGRFDYRFLGWGQRANGSALPFYTVQNTADPLKTVSLAALWHYEGDSKPAPDLFEPVTIAFSQSGQNQAWFEADSDINAGVIGQGPGFDKEGSTTFLSANGQSQFTFCQNENGLKAATIQNREGRILHSVLTIPSSLPGESKNPYDPIEASLGENTKTENILKFPANSQVFSLAPKLTINLPSEQEAARVNIPLEKESILSGTVALQIEPENESETIVPVAKSVIQNEAISIPVQGSQSFLVADNARTFSDEQDALAYAREAASFVSARDLMTGMGESEPKPFDFRASLSRGQFATILWRLQGKPASSGDYPEGIEPDAWNAKAARWAVERGLMAQGNSLFQPQAEITREQIITILWRMQDSPLAPLSALNPYGDKEEIHSTEFKLAMAWGIDLGLIGQGSGDRLNPKANASRMEIAAILQRFIEKIY